MASAISILKRVDQASMESYSSSLRAKLFMVVAVLVLGSGSSDGIRPLECMEEEMNGLLSLKNAFNFATDSSYDLLPSWKPNSTIHDCYCSWEGVVCSNLSNTTRVTQLLLSNTRSTREYLSSQDWYLDASMFLPFEELQVLDLSDNNGLIGLNGTLRLEKLQALHLEGNNRLNHVPDLAGLPSLKEVYLQRNPLKDLLPLQGLKLEVLDLGDTGSPDREYNLSIIGEMTSLTALSLAGNSLDLSFQDLCGLVNLEELDIRDNSFHGFLPTCLANMTSLHALDLKNNDLQGTIIPSIFSSLTSLEYLSLSGNSLQGSISFASSFGNSSKLEVFELMDNFYPLGIDTEDPLYLPPISSQMKKIRMSNCILNKQRGGVFPSFLLTQHELIQLELSHCGVQGDFPNWLLENNTKLSILNLSSNSISGKLDVNSSSTITLSVLDLSGNHLQGILPSNISSNFPHLSTVNMSNNMIHGSIPSLRGRIHILDLSSNKLTGELPHGFFTGHAVVFNLKLSDNFLSGRSLQIPGNISALYLNDNEFDGDFSFVPQNNTGVMLTTLDISNNRLKGAVPHSIGDIQYLRYLVLSNNHLKGSLPASFCNLKYLEFLDLSGNDIGPEMPPCTNLSSVKHLHLQSTNLRGLFPKFLHGGASSMVTLDLRGNALSGSVPSWIATLSNLRVLVLQGNNFSGAIPQNICQMSELSILDLSANHFSGGIPSCLHNLTFGKRDDSLIPLTPLTTSGYTVLAMAANCDYQGKICFGSAITEQYVTVENFVAVNFLTKNRLETYKGTVLQYMSGLDLSSNNLSGPIPPEIGRLSQLHALNLSNNHLSGSIPVTFPNLEQIESLDLSYNTLTGEIPPRMTQLFRLAVFSLAHNNLSGRTPEQKNQFSTFDRNCYEGNPLLCGLPLESCDIVEDPRAKSSDPIEIEVNPLKDVFWWSSAGAYLVAFVVTIFVLYLNNYFYPSTGFLGR